MKKVQERSNKYNQRKFYFFPNNHQEQKIKIDREKIVLTVEIVTLLKIFTVPSHLRFNHSRRNNFLSTMYKQFYHYHFHGFFSE